MIYSKISIMLSALIIILYLAASGVAKTTDRDNTESTEFSQDMEVENSNSCFTLFLNNF